MLPIVRELATAYLSNAAALPPTLASTILRVAAMGGDAALYDKYLARLKEPSSNPEEYYRYFTALTSFPDPALIDRTLEFAMSPDVRSQDTASLIGGVMGSPMGRDRAWTWVKGRWSQLEDKLGTFQSLPGVVGSLGSFCSPEAAADVRQFFAQHPVPSAERVLRQAVERIESCAAVDRRQSASLAKWVQASQQ